MNNPIKLELLQVIADRVAYCQKCELYQGKTKSVFSRGNINAKLIFLGEGPGQEEDQKGLPFVGRAGKLLDNMIQAMGLTENEVYITNIVKCRPPQNRKPLPSEMEACSEYLFPQLTLVDPQVIVTLGATATEGLLGSGPGITQRRGKWEKWKGIDVISTFHPAYCLRNPAKKQEVWEDLQQVMKALDISAS